MQTQTNAQERKVTRNNDLVPAGRFITVEGIEGAGKSTAIKTIHQVLTEHHIDHIVTREPGGTPYAEEIRKLLLHKKGEPVDEKTELLLMFASRAQHLGRLIEPSLKDGRWVLSDRFSDASYAYQGGGRQLTDAVIATLEQVVHPNRQPDLTLLLDVSASTGLKRISQRTTHDRIEQEKIAFFKSVRTSYIHRANKYPHRFVIIDANMVLSKVKSAIKAAVKEFIANHSHA
mgnify:CR=1 FL=1